MKKYLSIVLSFLLIASLVVACSEKKGDTGKGEDSDVVKIGVFEPITGAHAAGGEMTMEGINLANEEVPEVLGKKVQIFLVDNKSDKVEAANAVSRLIEKEKVVAIIGSYSSSLSMAAGDVVKNAKIPTVGCSPTNPLVTLNNDYYFRVCFIDPFQGTVMAKYAVDDLGAKNAAVISDVQQDYSVGLSNFFKKSFVKIVGDDNAIIAEVQYNSGDTDFTAQLTSLKEKNPDVIFAPGNYGECALLIKQARDLGITAPFLGGDTWEAPEFLSIGGDAVEGACYSSHFTAESPVNDVSSKFLKLYSDKYDKNANTFAAVGYDAYMVVIDAIKRADSIDSSKIREEIAKTKDFIGSTGTITLDENGDAVKSAVINKVVDGSFKYLTTVEP